MEFKKTAHVSWEKEGVIIRTYTPTHHPSPLFMHLQCLSLLHNSLLIKAEDFDCLLSENLDAVHS